MPYGSYQKEIAEAVMNARRFLDEAGCQAVKLEWFDQCCEVAEALVHAGIPVMGHVGLTPQTAQEFGGFKVQGKNAQSAQQIIERALALEQKGCFSVVLECIPYQISQIITQSLSIPTIGIGAGVHCDGQVLVTHDLLGFYSKYQLKFVKQYNRIGSIITESIEQFRDEVKNGQFPDKEHSFSIDPKELENVKGKS